MVCANLFHDISRDMDSGGYKIGVPLYLQSLTQLFSFVCYVKLNRHLVLLQESRRRPIAKATLKMYGNTNSIQERLVIGRYRMMTIH